MSRIKVENIRHPDGTGDNISLTDTGRVGIGATSPIVPFHVLTSATNTPGLFEHSGSVDSYLYLKNSTGGAYIASRTDDLSFHTSAGATERARIDSSGNLGIGTSSINQTASGRTVVGINGSTSAILNLNHGDTLAGFLYGASTEFRLEANGTRPLIFRGNDAERMRISSTGAVTIGATGSPGSLTVVGDVNNNELAIFNNLRTTGGYAEIDFRTAGTERGNIRWETGNVSYNTSSDYRLKENIRALTGGIELVKQLRPCLFNFIEAGPEDTLGGFIAHEVQEVVDYAVSGQKDEVRKDGSIKPQCIDQSKLVPLLTAALQEAIAKIETLEQRLSDAGIA